MIEEVVEVVEVECFEGGDYFVNSKLVWEEENYPIVVESLQTLRSEIRSCFWLIKDKINRNISFGNIWEKKKEEVVVLEEESENEEFFFRFIWKRTEKIGL